jgi:hypothetical protein
VTKIGWFGATFLVVLIGLYLPLTFLCSRKHPWRIYPDGDRECLSDVGQLLGICAGLLLGVSAGGLMVSILILICREIYQCCIHNGSNDISVQSGESGETESVVEIDESYMRFQLQLLGLQGETGPEQRAPRSNGAPANESIDNDVESNNELRLELDESKRPSQPDLAFSSTQEENQSRNGLDDES